MRITKAGHAIVDNDTHLSKWIEESGMIDHGLGIAKVYRKWFGPGDTAIDVGACLGDHTVPYAQIVGGIGKVYAFEPNPEAFECLIHNTKTYRQIECFNIGLSNTSGNMNFCRHANLGASYLETGDGNVSIATLDSINIVGNVKFIKIDVEGLELQVLEGAENIINKHRPIIMLEVGHQYRYGYNKLDIFHWLDKHSYRIGLDQDGNDTSKFTQPQYDLVAYPK